MTHFHPHLDENDKQVEIWDPHTATAEHTHMSSQHVATFTPGSSTHPELHTERSISTNYNPEHDAPMQPHPHMRQAAGVIIHHGDGRVVVVSPTNRFGGYENTFPKGGIEKGHTAHHTAVKEAEEESGFKVKLTGHLGDYDRTTSRNRYYVGERTGGDPSKMGWESQAVHLVPIEHLDKFVDSDSDKKIARDFQRYHANQQRSKSILESWQNLRLFSK